MQRSLYPPRSAILSGVALTLALSSLGAEATPPEQDVLRADEEMARAAAAKDTQALSRMLLPEIQFLRDGALVQGLDEALKAWAELLDPSSTKTLLWQPETATVAGSGDLAFSTGSFQVVEASAEGEQKVLHQGHYVTIWRRKAKEWKVVADAPLEPLDEAKLKLRLRMDEQPPRMFLQGPNSTVRRAVRVFPSADASLAYAVGEYRAPSKPGESGARHGVFLTVWQRQEEGWWLAASSFPEPR